MSATTHRPSLIAVLAHPDDELFHSGVVAHLSGRGVRMTIACATRGEAGRDPRERQRGERSWHAAHVRTPPIVRAARHRSADPV